MLFVAGGIIWANVIGGYEAWIDYFEGREMWKDPSVSEYGWPTPAFWYSKQWYRIEYENVGLDIIAALILLYAVWFVCEWLIRWRAARKGA